MYDVASSPSMCKKLNRCFLKVEGELCQRSSCLIFMDMREPGLCR